jgi:predicted signal transduction protein with EAL and GGDEF domain
VSAVPGNVALPEVPGPIDEHRPDKKAPIRATIYFSVIGVVAAAASIPLLTHLRGGTHSWATFIILGSAAAIAQLFVVRTPRNQAYHTTIVFLIPAVMLLPPELVALIGVIQHVPEWLKNRNAWYSQIFNICNWTISLLASWATFHATLGAGHLLPNDHLRLALAGMAAATVFVAINHILLAPMLHFFYSHSIRELGIFSFESLSTDLVLAALGVGIGTFWDINPWLLPFAVAPLLLIHRSLSVPQLQEEARVDPKTGLFNARYFAAALAEELARSQRFERPMTLIMADLDLLRDINNSRASPRRSGHSCATTTSPLASAARSSRSSCRRRRPSWPSRSPSGSGEQSQPLRSTSKPRASRFAPPCRSASPPSPATRPTRTS